MEVFYFLGQEFTPLRCCRSRQIWGLTARVYRIMLKGQPWRSEKLIWKHSHLCRFIRTSDCAFSYMDSRGSVKLWLYHWKIWKKVVIGYFLSGWGEVQRLKVEGCVCQISIRSRVP
jgi:hypothetical protein